MRYYIHLLNYNSYYNRQLKREENLNDYLRYEIAPYKNENGDLRDINIKVGDGISCKTEALFWNENFKEPNYCILEDRETGELSRWFVMEFEKNVGGQYIATLYRDTLAEEKNDLINNFPILIEKGYVNDDNPLILNLEDFKCNQIKSKEIKLYDKSGIPWIVIYFSDDKNIQTYDIKLSYDNIVYIRESIEGDSIKNCLNVIDPKLYSIYNQNIVSEGPIGDNIKRYDYNYISEIINKYDKKYQYFNINGTSKCYKFNFETFYDITYDRNIYRMYLLDVTSFVGSTIKTTIELSGNTLFLPFSDLVFDTNIIKNICKDIQNQVGASSIFDVQILPYNMFSEGSGINRYISTYSFDILDNYNNELYLGRKSQIFKIGVGNDEFLLKGRYASSSNELYGTQTISISNKYNHIPKKLLKNLYKFRLCSPNYNGSFDFNIADLMLNSNSDLKFNIDVTYKPYSPYIHVNPVFSGLYGNDYNDARGLICGGEFSTEQTSDSWANYKLQNKNFQNQFDRQILNMERNREVDRISSYVNDAFELDKFIKNQASFATSELKYLESIDYRQDMFEFNLQNIQAIPYSISKVSPLNNNNKLVPILEIYKCTEQEEQAFINKLTYNSYTINVIGNFKDYIREAEYEDSETFLKGKLIRYISENSKDNHYIETLYNEINKGFYYKP